MLELPFQTKMTDKLAAILRRITAEHLPDTPDALPSIVWQCFVTGPRAGSSNWVLGSFSRKFMRPEDIVTVGDISFHLPVGDRHRLIGRILDWSEQEGLVAYEGAA